MFCSAILLTLCFTTVLCTQSINSSTTTATTTVAAPPERLRSLRLPNTTFPLHYHFHLHSDIHLGTFDYDGSIVIVVKVRETTDEIVLHAKELNGFTVNVSDLPSGIQRDDITFTYDDKLNFIIIHAYGYYQAFERDQLLRIEINFKGIMRSRPQGIYWLNYTLDHNQTMYLAATQFEPTSARLAFPCYDEPALKANFSLSITHSNTYMAIANMPVLKIQQHASPNMLTTLFETTPPISTYLVAFVLYKNFNYISDKQRGIEQRLYTPINAQSKGLLALKNAVITVTAIENYFGVKYPLSKLDHIALNKNYGSAMENWGLITYRDDGLVYANKTGSHSKLKDTLTVNHEIAHQWFGNLVSPEWWSYAWLNEGFATYFSYVLADKLHPEWKVMDFFLTDVTDYAFTYSQITVRPMTHYVESETEIRAVFDIITYQKAACVIKMFHHAFIDQTFVRGISIYLHKYQFSSANELNLFSAIQMAVEENPELRDQSWAGSIADMMISWTHSELIPIVSVIVNYQNKSITLKQRANGVNSESRWWIPLNFATRSSPHFSNTSASYFMPPLGEISISLSDLGIDMAKGDWIIVNKQQTGFYHVNYEHDNMNAIARQLLEDHSKIHPFNRAAIFRDLTPLIENNDIESMDPIFELLSYLQHENEWLLWNHVGDLILLLEKNLYGTSSHSLYKDFIRRLVTPIFNKMRQKSFHEVLTSIETLARQKIIELSCMTDSEDCLAYTSKITQDYIMGKSNALDVEDVYGMHDTLLCLSMKFLSPVEFQNILNRLIVADRSSMWYNDMIYSLRCMHDNSQLEKYLNILMIDEMATDGDSMLYLFYLFKSNMGARSIVLDFMENNYKSLCRSDVFIDNFNRFAEYIPTHLRDHFLVIRHAIVEELQADNNIERRSKNIIIEADSSRIGKKVQRREKFVAQFEQQIYSWLLRHRDQFFYASASSVHNSADNISLHLVTKKLLKFMKSLL